jgi:hypothetical protein
MDMSDMEKIFVADRIRDLRQDAVGVRGGHGRDLPAAPRGAAAGPRLRVGRWLIGLGRAIGGRSVEAPGTADACDPMANPV